MTSDETDLAQIRKQPFLYRLLPVANNADEYASNWYGYTVVFVLSLLVTGEVILGQETGVHRELGQLLQFLAAGIAVVPMFARTTLSIFDDDAEAFADLLVSVAVFGALVTGEYVAAAIVPLIMDLGHYLEQKGIQGTRSAIDGLQKLSAKNSNPTQRTERTDHSR